MDVRDEARKLFARIEHPTYRFEFIYWPGPSVKPGTKGTVHFEMSGRVVDEPVQYMGNGRWLGVDLATWLDETNYETE
jgi:hypothetical protein